MPEAVLVCDPDDRIRIVNAAADRLFKGCPVRNRADLLTRFEPLPTDPDPDRPVTLRSRDVPNRWFELRSVAVNRGTGVPDSGATGSERATGRILILRDITELRLARAERRAFLSILSHELRTPITTIYAGSRVLARRGPERPAGTEIAADISAEAAHLYDVVEDLLVLTRAEQGLLDLSVEPVLLQRLVETSIRLAATRVPTVPIVRSGITDPPAVQGDPVYIEQVIRNLVTAASRYGGPGSPVTIRMEADEHEVIVRVIDRGPDLRPRDAERLLELVDDPRSARQGAGIGPFVCRRIVESLGGRIWVSSAEGGGAEIGFALRRYEDLAEDGLSA